MENYEPQISTVLRLRNTILGQWLWNVAPGPASAPALPGLLLEMQTIGLHLSSTERTGPTTCVFTSAPHDSDAGQSSQTTLLGPSERVGGAPLLTLHTHKSSKSKSKWTSKFVACGILPVRILDQLDTLPCFRSDKKMPLARPGPSCNVQEPDSIMINSLGRPRAPPISASLDSKVLLLATYKWMYIGPPLKSDSRRDAYIYVISIIIVNKDSDDYCFWRTFTCMISFCNTALGIKFCNHAHFRDEETETYDCMLGTVHLMQTYYTWFAKH